MKHLLNETYQMVGKVTGYNALTPKGYFQTIADPEAFKVYAKSLAQDLNESDRSSFLKLAKNTRKAILEGANSMTALTPYETLTIPILRNFYPKLVAKELVNVMPIDKPEVVKYFIKPTFTRQIADSTGYHADSTTYTFPSINDYDTSRYYNKNDVSKAPGWGYSANADVTSASVNVLSAMGIDPSLPAHLEKDFNIVGLIDSTGGVTAVNIYTTVDGVFSVPVILDNAQTDVVSGQVDFQGGYLYWNANSGNVKGLRYRANATLEENNLSAKANFEMEKIRLTAVDRRISTTWTTNMEQDVKALFDITLQSELINIMGEQLALDIDSEIINDLLTVNATQNAASHAVTFKTRQPSSYVQGPKEWLGEIIPVMNTLSAQIYNDTQMGSANTVACNPIDAAILESLNSYEYLGDSSAGGEAGYRSATVASGKWKVLVSSNVPAGKMIVNYRSDNMQKASYVYSPYVPALLLPYPLGANPTLTIQTRYATKALRPKAVGVVAIDRVNQATL